MNRRGLTVLVAAKLHKNQLERHLELFEHVPEVSRVVVVRHEPLPERLSKLENRPFSPGARPIEALRLMRAVTKVAREERVDWVIGFNPVPWGSLAFLAAKRSRVPTCLSLIGMDFLQVQAWWGRPFLQAIRHADAVTVTGSGMRTGLLSLGVEGQKIHVLPHSVDTTRFTPSYEPKKYDLVSVGQLIKRKRMDVLIDALSELRVRGLELSLGILGRGDQEALLRAQVERLGLDKQVDFLGYRNDVETILASARVFCLVSEWEGVPFAMMEAMASGLVPVVTDVGTIADWVRDHENGRIVPVGSSAALADVFYDLFRERPASLEQMRRTVEGERDRLGFAAGAQVWRDVLGLTPQPSRIS